MTLLSPAPSHSETNGAGRADSRSFSRIGRLACPVLLLLAPACGDEAPPAAVDFDDGRAMKSYQGKAATRHTQRMLARAERQLPQGDFADGSMMSDHNRDELIAPLPDTVGTVDYRDFDFLDGAEPGPIHPSLLAAARETSHSQGVYKVMDGVYQIRADIAHVTLVRGATGWIALDVGIAREFAEDIWPYVHERLPGGTEVPVSAVVYSHSHADHFGGVKGFVDVEAVAAGRVEVIAPHGFMAHALSENVIAGSAMLRRAQYHFGALLDPKPDGTEFVALGVALRGTAGEFTLIAPTITLPEGPGEVTELTVDGVPMQFKDISGAEAPAASLVYLPQRRLLFNSELVYRGLHNVYTLRGAQVRDALAWSKVINEVIREWGGEVETLIGPHGPAFSGNEKIVEFLRVQRDNYGFIHNQSVRLINSGMKLQDVGQAIEELVPESLSNLWHTHGYHGTYSHNARGVVNRYLGFYDGNPANLNPLPLEEEAKKFVEYMGGAETILSRAREDFADGEYRFVATALNKLVTAEPRNWPARHLLADAYEQLGYQSEGPQWRNAYLTAAKELRTGVIRSVARQGPQLDMLAAATTENLLDSMAVRVDSEAAGDLEASVALVIPDRGETWLLELAHGNLSYIQVEAAPDADTAITLDGTDLVRLLTGQVGIRELFGIGVDAISGSRLTLVRILRVLEKPDPLFAIVPMPE